MNSRLYKETLVETLLPHFCLGEKFQDNVPYHVSGETMTFLENCMDVVTDWPSQLPDLNVFEDLWAILKNRVFKRNPKNIDTLWTVINEQFFKIDNETIKKLYDSISNRMNSVIKKEATQLSIEHYLINLTLCFICFHYVFS